MAAAVTRNHIGHMGDKRAVMGTIAFDSSYPTGGEAITEEALGLVSAEMVIIPSFGGYTFTWDATNSKVIAYWVDTTTDGAALAQVADTTDLSALTAVPYLAIGT